MSDYPNGAILDEIQRVPELLSYLQEILDASDQKGLFVLTGSNNFIPQEGISQSLAGRVAYLNLLPLSLNEIKGSPLDVDELMFTGGYPALHHENISPAKWYANYIRTYLERDVRLIKNINDLLAFERFLRLCAGRVGQLLNMSNLALETGVDVKTIKSWISVLETSFVLFRLPPHHKNFNKRIVKMPKLYFYDTGLACALLRIDEPGQLTLHPLRGSIFENLVIADFLKQRYHAGQTNNLYFWRDSTGHEIDLIIENATGLKPVEIKSGQTITDAFFKGLLFWNDISNTKGGYVVYAGSIKQKRSNGIHVIPFRESGDFLSEKP